MIFSTLLYYRVIQIYGCNLVNCRNITFLICALLCRYNILLLRLEVYIKQFFFFVYLFSARSFWFIDIVVSVDIWTLELLPEWMRCGFVICNSRDRYNQSIWNVCRLYETETLCCEIVFCEIYCSDDGRWCELRLLLNNARHLITYLNCFCCRILLRCRHFMLRFIGCVSICFLLHWNEKSLKY